MLPMYIGVEGVFSLTRPLHGSSSHSTWDEKHFHGQANSKKPVQYPSGKT